MMYIVIMLEKAHPDELLSCGGDINEVFGPFETDDAAVKWADIQRQRIPNRHWIVIDVTHPNVMNPERN